MPICDYITFSKSDPLTTIRITFKDESINFAIKQNSEKASINLDLNSVEDKDYLRNIVKSINIALDEKI